MENLPPTTYSANGLSKLTEKRKQISHFIHQCFAALDKFGVTPEELRIRMATMESDLLEFHLQDITRAFTEYRRNNEKIPTGSAIRKLILSYLKARAPKNSKWVPDVTFTQVVRERKRDWDGEILEEFSHGNHKSPIFLENYFHPKHICISYKRDESL